MDSPFDPSDSRRPKATSSQRAGPRIDPAQLIQDLYDSEINARIEWLYDVGFEVTVGDALNGEIVTGHAKTFTEAIDWLRATVVTFAPGSAFAYKYGPTGAAGPDNDR
jgi:hypothetical protein